MNLLDGLKVKFHTDNRYSFDSDSSHEEGVIIQTSITCSNSTSFNVVIMCCSKKFYHYGKIYIKNMEQIKLMNEDIQKLTRHPEKMVKRIKTVKTIKNEERIASRSDILDL